MTIDKTPPTPDEAPGRPDEPGKSEEEHGRETAPGQMPDAETKPVVPTDEPDAGEATPKTSGEIGGEPVDDDGQEGA